MTTVSENSYAFQTDTQKILKIIIHSLYQHKEIFLRELISNASDALNKVRIKMLTSEKIYDKDLDLKIEILADEENTTLTVRDYGIGMTKQELIDNLGTIAKSGTEEFLQAMESGESTDSLIGRFGVGFYSAFLVSDEVQVLTRSYKPTAKAYRWVSDGENEFTIETTEKEHRGTDIILKLKEEFKNLTSEHELRELVKRYSNYVEFPIMHGEDKLNDVKAIWRVSPSEVEEKDYEDFYRYLGQWGSPKAKIHVTADVPIEFYSILYVPPTRPRMQASEKEWGLRLYNRKVLIEEYNKDLLPEYLRFVIGVVDAEDLDLNVSREVLQNSRVQRQIKNYLEKKLLDEFEKLAKNSEDEYMQFYKEFGPFLKEGIAGENKQKDKLIDLLRFYSTNEEDGASGAVTLSKYLERMKVGQDQIYYLSGLDLDLLKKSPHLEYYKKEGYEVLLLGEPIDSFLMMHLTEYQEKKFFLIDQDETQETPSEVQEDAEGEEGEEKPKVKTGPFAPLLNKFVEVLGTKVSDVTLSDRMVNSVARLVTPKGGISSDLQRAMRIMESSQGTPGLNLPMMGKILQINPNHDIIKQMNEMVNNDSEYTFLKDLIEQIHDNARIIDGDVPDFTSMMPRLERIMEKSLQ